MSGNQVVLTFAGDSTKLEKTFDKVGSASEHMQQRTTMSFSAFKLVAAEAMAKAGEALFDFAKDSVKAFADSEQSHAALADAFQRFPALADSNVEAMEKFNEELEKKTKFDHEATASGEAVLAQFNLTGSQIQQLTPLLQDYAAKTGKDLPTAAQDLGKALLGQGRALKDIGINFKDTKSSAGNFKELMDGLNQKVGGFAENQGKTAAGQAAILNNQFENLKESVGAQLLPVLLKLSEVGLKVVEWISQNKQIVLPLIGVIGLVTAAQWAWNAAMAANPIVLTIIAIAALVAAIVYVATKTTFFQTLWKDVWGGVKSIASGVVNWFESVPSLIGKAFSGLVNIILWPYKTAFNLIADAWNNTIGRLQWTVPSWVPLIGGNTIGAPRLPKFHSGGTVPGLPGQEVLAVLQAGETVTPAGASNNSNTSIELRPVGGSGFDRMMLEYLTELLRANNLRLVRA